MNARLAINVTVLIWVEAALVIIGLHVFSQRQTRSKPYWHRLSVPNPYPQDINAISLTMEEPIWTHISIRWDTLILNRDCGRWAYQRVPNYITLHPTPALHLHAWIQNRGRFAFVHKATPAPVVITMYFRVNPVWVGKIPPRNIIEKDANHFAIFTIMVFVNIWLEVKASSRVWIMKLRVSYRQLWMESITPASGMLGLRCSCNLERRQGAHAHVCARHWWVKSNVFLNHFFKCL